MSGPGVMFAWTARLAAAVTVAWGGAAAVAGDAGQKAHPLPGLAAGGAVAVETVYFGEHSQWPVKLLRGVPRPVARPAQPPAAVPPQRTQIVSFGTGFAQQVTIVRGGMLPLGPGAPHPSAGVEKVSFANPQQRPVSIIRSGLIRELFSIDLFGPANAGELDRIAFAVDGVESRHGADPGMWRPSLTGPQGPMQVTAAAAFDVGGGDRFDIAQNRLLGRAYLAQMFQRYGNWQDALAAYNWGPGNIDLWIAGGRPAELLPTGVAYYVARVLRDALITAAR